MILGNAISFESLDQEDSNKVPKCVGSRELLSYIANAGPLLYFKKKKNCPEIVKEITSVAYFQEQQSEDVNPLHGLEVLGSPRKTQLTQALEGTMFYSYKETEQGQLQ